MSRLNNSVHLIGRLGTEPEIRDYEGGKRKATFSLATNEVYYNNKNEKVNDTTWHQIVVWGKKVDIVERFLQKGSEVAVEGRLQRRSYEKEGVKRYVTEINLNELQMIGPKVNG